jgi:arsenate reductase
LLREHGVEPEIVAYLDDPPDRATLEDLLAKLDMEPRDLLRKREKVYTELGLSDPGLGRDDLIGAIADHPRLLERPIVVNGDRAALGRPIERVLDVVDG